MRKIKYTLIMFLIIILQVFLMNLNSECMAETNEEIYDVVLFWGQSNMVGSCHKNLEKRYIPSDELSVKEFSKLSGIDTDILKNNTQYRNYVKIDVEDNIAFEYLYSTDSLEKITATGSESYGEHLKFDTILEDGTPSNLIVSPTSGRALSMSSGTNMIPEFCKIYYEATGHKIIVVFAALGGKPIRQFLPCSDAANDVKTKLYIYEALKIKYNSALEYLSKNNYKIGNKLYVVFQGESDISRTTAEYKRDFLKVHNNLKKDLGITLGAICETSGRIGISSTTLAKVKNVHDAQEQLISENNDIILGSSYAYDTFVPTVNEYDQCITKVCYDENGNKLSYEEALKKASYGVDFYKEGDESMTVSTKANDIHFTSASLSQIGKESALALGAIESIQIKNEPTKKQYIQNYEDLNLEGAKLLIDFKNIKDEEINITKDMITGFDNSKIGIQTLTVTYKGLKAKFNVEIKEKQIREINLIMKPTKLEYIQNYESLDVTNGKIEISYNDNSKSQINITQNMVTGFDNSKLGVKTLTVTYQEFKVQYDVIIKKKEITQVDISKVPTKTEYIQNYEELDVSGGKIKISYNDETKEEKDILAEMVSGFDNSKLGTQTLLVKYNDFTAKFNIVINAKQLIKIEIKSKPTKLEYIQNYENLDVTNGIITLFYNDESNEDIEILPEMITGFDNSKLGSQTLIVNYEGKSTSYNINILEKQIVKIKINKMPNKTKYIKNYDVLDVNGGKLEVLYNDNTSEIIDLTLEMISNFDNSKEGTRSLLVNYFEKNTSYDITIVEKEIISIILNTPPIKKEYIQNYEKIDLSGATLKVLYNDESYEIIDISEDLILNYDNSKLGVQEVTISYGEYSEKFEITIIEKSISKVKIDKIPTKLEYIKDKETLDVSGGVLKVFYNDETFELIQMTNEMVSGFDNNILGTIQLIVNYKNYTDTYNVKIIQDTIVIEDQKKPSDIKDTTISPIILPNTGFRNLIIFIGCLIIVVVISIIKLQNYRDVK